MQIGSILITSLFLALWAAIQWGTSRLIEWVQPSGIDQLVFWVYQAIFGTTTLIPILIYYYVDIKTSWIKTQAQIKIAQVREVGEVVQKTKARKIAQEPEIRKIAQEIEAREITQEMGFKED
jgi:hypothetical protein